MLIKQKLLIETIQRRIPALYFREVKRLLNITVKILIRRLMNRSTINIKGLGVIVRKEWLLQKLFNVNKGKFRVVKPVSAKIIPDTELLEYITSEPIKSIIIDLLINKWAAIKDYKNSYGKKLKATM